MNIILPLTFFPLLVMPFNFAFAKLNGASLLSLLFTGHVKAIVKDVHDLQLVFAVYGLEICLHLLHSYC